MVRSVLVACLVFGLVACGDDSVSPADVAGTYTLLSVDGVGLPLVLEESPDFLLELTSGSATLNQDLTCSLSFTQTETDQGTVTTDTLLQACTYSLDDGLTLTLTAENVNVGGSILGSTLTIDDGGRVFVYLM